MLLFSISFSFLLSQNRNILLITRQILSESTNTPNGMRLGAYQRERVKGIQRNETECRLNESLVNERNKHWMKNSNRSSSVDDDGGGSGNNSNSGFTHVVKLSVLALVREYEWVRFVLYAMPCCAVLCMQT